MTDEDDGHDDETEIAAFVLPDAASTDGVRRQQNRVKREQREGDAFWKAVFADKVGRREMWRLLSQLHPFEERFACGPNGFPQSEATWFHAGEQSFGLRLYHSWVKIDRAGVFAMHDEHDPRFSKPVQRRTQEPQ